MVDKNEALTPLSKELVEPPVEPPPVEETGFTATCKKIARWTWDLACEHWFILGVGFAIGAWAMTPVSVSPGLAIHPLSLPTWTPALT